MQVWTAGSTWAAVEQPGGGLPLLEEPYVVVLPREKWVGQKVLVSVLERELSVERRW